MKLFKTVLCCFLPFSCQGVSRTAKSDSARLSALMCPQVTVAQVRQFSHR